MDVPAKKEGGIAAQSDRTNKSLPGGLVQQA
jgi:hypothetical protein